QAIRRSRGRRRGWNPRRGPLPAGGGRGRLRLLVRDPEKWEPVFGKDHAQTKVDHDLGPSGSSKMGGATALLPLSLRRGSRRGTGGGADMRGALVVFGVAIAAWLTPATAQNARAPKIWDIKVGTPVGAL